MNRKVLIAMSGGVDSSVSAALLKEKGYLCEGAFMITHDQAASAKNDALDVAKSIGIKLHILDWRERFERVLDYFSSEYKKGRTPNPCVFCNRNIKFAGLFEFAKQIGLDYIATGHYCRVVQINGSSYLYKSRNIAKDQSYALSMVNREIFDKLLLPVGDHDKDQIRKIAAQLGLGIEDKPDSQEICFIPDNDYVATLEARCPELIKDGAVVDNRGNKIGTHQGVHKFTIGQRRGLGIALGEPAYVVELDAKNNIVKLGSKAQLNTVELTAGDVNWLTDKPGQPFNSIVKIRYNHKGAPATVIPYGNNSVKVKFKSAVSAVTPGQAAVFYIDDQYGSRVIGGGWIEKAVT